MKLFHYLGLLIQNVRKRYILVLLSIWFIILWRYLSLQSSVPIESNIEQQDQQEIVTTNQVEATPSLVADGNKIDYDHNMYCANELGSMIGYFDDKTQFQLVDNSTCQITVRVQDPGGFIRLNELVGDRKLFFLGNSVNRHLGVEIAEGFGKLMLKDRKAEKVYCGQKADEVCAFTPNVAFAWLQWFYQPALPPEHAERIYTTHNLGDSCSLFGNLYGNFSNCLRRLSNLFGGLTKKDVVVIMIGQHYVMRGDPTIARDGYEYVPGPNDRELFIKVVKEVFPGIIIFVNPCQLKPCNEHLQRVLDGNIEIKYKLPLFQSNLQCSLHYDWYVDHIHHNRRLAFAHIDVIFSMVEYLIKAGY
jgi:hypothetical protein